MIIEDVLANAPEQWVTLCRESLSLRPSRVTAQKPARTPSIKMEQINKDQDDHFTCLHHKGNDITAHKDFKLRMLDLCLSFNKAWNNFQILFNGWFTLCFVMSTYLIEKSAC